MEGFALKASIPSLKIVKTIKVFREDKVYETFGQIMKKVKEEDDGGYLLYRQKGDDPLHPIPLDMNKTLGESGFFQTDTLLIKREPKEIFIFFVELEKRQRFCIDFNDTINDLFNQSVYVFDIKKPEECFLVRDGEENPLDREKTLLQLKISPGSLLILRNRKLNVSAMAKNVSVFLQKKVEQGIQQGAEKIRNKIKEHEQKRERGSVKKLFGIPLEDAVLVGNHSYEIPFIVEKVIQYVEQNHMHTEGIFRLSGAATISNSLKEQFDRGEDPDLTNVIDPHSITGCLKYFLRELPEPPVPFDYFSVFASIVSSPPSTQDGRAFYYRTIIKSFPRINYLLLRRLLSFLHTLAKNSDTTKMTTHNLATVFGPNLIRQKNESALESVENTMLVSQVVDDLIRMYPQVFEFHGKETKIVSLAVALYPYAGQNEQELNFEQGQFIFISNNEGTDGWWEGEYHSYSGLIPANYVEIFLDFTKMELNDDINRITLHFKDEIKSLQKEITSDIQKRKEMEIIIQVLFEKYQELLHRLQEAETRNINLKKQLEGL